MSKINLIIVSVVVVIISLVVGGVVGMAMQAQKDSVGLNKLTILAPMETAVKALSSKAVPSIIAYGQVSNIEGKKVTLSYSGETLVINVAENANIYALTPVVGAKTPTAPVQRKALFTEIKKGDNLNITLKLSAEGLISGQSVIILNAK